MAIVSPSSIIYLVIRGEKKGRICVVRETENNNNVYIGVIFVDCGDDRIMVMRKGDLAQLETPGWPEKIHERPYGLKEYFEIHKGDGTNMLRTATIVQPRALKTGDVIATGEKVVEEQRMGHNSSSLVRLEKTGWVELAPRLPIALQGNKKFRLPYDLVWNDNLATGCLVVSPPTSFKVNWINIFLDRKNCLIEVPSCIPLALG